jgi:isoleucyl-tRNA synthetase
MMTQLADAYRKIRNTFRFALSNLFDFDPARDAVSDSQLLEMDAWMIRRTGALVKQCLAWYEKFEFHRAYHAIHDFCTVDLSAFYFDVLKDRLYTSAPRNIGRRSAQTAVHRIADALVRLVAPMLVFTAEEVWKYLPRAAGEAESVHMATFPSAETLESAVSEQVAKKWEQLLAAREGVVKSLEPARAEKLITSGLEAGVTLSADPGLANLLQEYREILPRLFIVSQVEVKNGSTDGLKIAVARADGKKCERCWNYSTHVGESSAYPTVCERCIAALSEIDRDGAATAVKSS